MGCDAGCGAELLGYQPFRVPTGLGFAPQPVSPSSCNPAAVRPALRSPQLSFNQPGPQGWELGGGRAQPQPLLPHLLAASSPEQGLVPGGGQLQISALQPSHQGRYTCLARGEGAETRKDFLVLVRGEARWVGGGPWALPPPRGEPSSSSFSCPPQPLSSLSRTVAPRILGAGVPSEHSVLEGGEVRLECQAEGQPPPQISWLKDGQPLQLQPPSRAQ